MYLQWSHPGCTCSTSLPAQNELWQFFCNNLGFNLPFQWKTGVIISTLWCNCRACNCGTAAPPNLHLASSEQWCWSGGRGILTELSLCYSIVHCTIIMSISFRLVYWISLGLALSPPSTSVSSDFMVLSKCLKKLYLLHFTLYMAWPGGIGPWPDGLTNYCPSVLDTVGWVIWHVKIVLDMTYNVFGGTLNSTLLYMWFSLLPQCLLTQWTGSIWNHSQQLDMTTVKTYMTQGHCCSELQM